MSASEFSFTPEQKAAIKHRGGSLLVSAAAGSGKTKVLVERLLGHVEDGDNVDDFLVITYTRAAATELREKIYDEVLKRIAVNTDNRRMRRQSMLCRSAAIGTIHSFCTDILRENAYLADISPDFRVSDEQDSEIIKATVLENVLDEAYEKIESSDNFRALIDAALSGRDDKRLARMILDVHTMLKSKPNPQAWMKEQIKKLSTLGVTDISETVWGKHLSEKTRRSVHHWYGEMVRLREEMKIYPDFDEAYATSVDTSIAGCDAFLNALDRSWEEAHKLSEIEFPRPKSIKGYDGLKNIRQKCKDELNKCAAVFSCSSEEHIDDIQSIAPAVASLMQLILDFDSKYTDEKRSRGIVDFSDLEHLTLTLLIDRETGEKTELACAISKRFKEIMVDEYQDINEVQELIFNAVSQESKNIFMVGDVKQSIYRFRLADPSIFLGKYKIAMSEERREYAEGNAELALILLSKNFRSRTGILDFVNFVFERIMSEEFGELDYTDREKLVPGRWDDGDIEPAIELEVIDMSDLDSDEDEESPANVQIEAQFIAERISEMTNSAYSIPDGQGGTRRIEYSDIAILLRTVSGKAWQYAGALAEYGIPADTPDSDGYFETVEVSAALSLLSVIDNPMQDIPLAAALRGPVYGFSADELAEIRSASMGTDYYSAVVKAAFSNKKCADFLREIDELRMLAVDMPVVRFIWHFYNKTGLLGRVGAMRRGNKRRNNLIHLAEYAHKFEQNGHKGLFGFLTHIRDIQDKGAQLAGYDTVLSQNVVRIMSIHKSKGLEFPIVFLADTSKQFNYMDMQKPLVLHPEFGVGLKRIDRQRRIEYPTIARMAIQSKLRQEMLAEELRVLYVAMTRAREKLIITAVFKDAGRKIGGIGAVRGTRSEGKGKYDIRIPPAVLEDVKCMAEWIFAALAPLLKGSGNEDDTLCRNSSEIEGQGAQDGNQAIGGGKAWCWDSSEILPENWKMRVIPASRFFGATSSVSPPRNTLEKPIVSCIPYTSAGDNTTLVENDASPQPSPLPPPSTTEERSKINDSLSLNHDSYSEERDATPQSEALERLHKQFSFLYPHVSAPDLPSKLTVTELKGRFIDTDAADDSEKVVYAKEQVARKRMFNFENPGFISKKTGLTAAERGTALHLAMQYIDFQKCISAEGIDNELRRLVGMGFLTDQQADAVDTQKIMRFFESAIGKRVIEAANVKREFKFSLLSQAERFFPGGGEDKILLQGIVDCFFEEGKELIIIDFKTDHVTQDTLEEKASNYTPQLAAYSDALERITGKYVKERIIYFFAIDAACTV